MKRKKINLLALKFVTGFILLLVVSILIISCYKEEIIQDDESNEENVIPGTGLADWTTETHSNDIAPNYSVVFPQDKVNRVDLVISASNWSKMQADLSSNLSSSAGGGPGGGGQTLSNYTPVFVPASVFFNGKEWYNVGIRYKGNSSLRSAWQSGVKKLSFRFDFDEYEDTYPEIKNQRFYGFQKMSFSNNFEDVSFLHEKLATDIFRNAGLKAPQTAYFRIFVDYGEGSKYFGLYTAVEVVEDTMLDSQFGSSTGNCYKPDGATFKAGSFSIATFEKKTNEDLADYSDVQKLITNLNAATRTTNSDQWKSDLESIFDVDNFMKWLAVNTVIQNWDTYGKMTHNFYLYNDPATQKIVWIPWDNNEALSPGKQTALSLSLSEVKDVWPLIRYLVDTPEYKTKYLNYLSQTINGAFKPADIKVKYQYYYNLIQPYINGSEGEVTGYTFQKSTLDFANALTTQKNHVDTRFNAVTSFLNNL